MIAFINRLVWGAPTLVLILGTGLYLSIRTGFAQFTFFPQAARHFCAQFQKNDRCGGISPLRALCTALAATVGTGNLVGVAGAIALGGPGSVFWMWICAWLGMMTKFAEATLAVRFRVHENHACLGGPMYMIERGLGKKWRPLAKCYALFGLIAAFGVGNAAQVSAVVAQLNAVITFAGGQGSTGVNLLIGICLAAAVGAALFGGAKRIGAAAELLMPFASCGYILLCTVTLIARAQAVPAALAAILRGAFSPAAATGGMIGSAFQALRVGVSRGVFTNEAGMGTASIAHASAHVQHPAEQGLMGMVEVFLDTVVICTLTALVILCSGVPISYGMDAGAELTTQAFSAVCGEGVSVFLAVALCLFAFATILGWGFYGVRCAQYLFGQNAWRSFAVLQTAMVIPGAVLSGSRIWTFSEMFNGLMAIPNLIALLALSPELVRLTRQYQRYSDPTWVAGGTNEDIHQCESLRTVSHAEIPSAGCRGRRKREKNIPSEHRAAGSADATGVF